MPLPHGARAAISLTYDDALPIHRALVAPELSARGLRGTFYVPAAAADLHEHRDAWARIAADGHELGNHTVFHPCRRKEGAAWPDPAYDLRGYSEQRFEDELVLANRVLHGIDGRPTRSYAATCGARFIGPDDAQRDVTAIMLRQVAAVRAGTRPDHSPLRATPLVDAYMGDLKTAEAFIAAIDATVAAGGWLPVMMHGVGEGTHHLFVTVDAHRRVLDHIASLRSVLWSAPFVEVHAALTHAA